MSDNIFRKLTRAMPLVKDQGWAGFARYWMTSTAPQTSAPAIGPTSTEVLAADERIRRSMTGSAKGASPIPGGRNRQSAKLTLPTLVGL